jgi:hypothetical protein
LSNFGLNGSSSNWVIGFDCFVGYMKPQTLTRRDGTGK